MSDETTPDLMAPLAEHWNYDLDHDGDHWLCDCGEQIGNRQTPDLDMAQRAHLAEQITAAGFGPVRALEGSAAFKVGLEAGYTEAMERVQAERDPRPRGGAMSGPVSVGKIGLNWIAECDEHAEIIWCSDWAMALEAAYGHVAMHHPRICDHEIGFIISDRHRCLGCGIDLPPLTLSNLDTSPSQEDAS